MHWLQCCRCEALSGGEDLFALAEEACLGGAGSCICRADSRCSTAPHACTGFYMRMHDLEATAAGGHVFALIEEEQSEQLAAEITSELLNMSEGEILHMLRSRDALDVQVGRRISLARA